MFAAARDAFYAAVSPAEAIDNVMGQGPVLDKRVRSGSKGSGAPKVAVVGAGVIGLSIAWRLTQAGCSVNLYDRSAAGRGASWAAAGMLEVAAEDSLRHEALVELGRSSRLLWPEFAAELERAASREIGFRAEGALSVARSAAEVDHLRSVYERQRIFGLEVSWLSREETLELEPNLAADVEAGLHCPSDAQVDSRRLVDALKLAASRSGVMFHEHKAVRAVSCAGSAVRAIQVGGRARPADIVIIAAGHGSSDIVIEGAPPVRVTPVKGQMLALRMDRDKPLLNHAIRSGRSYLAPRRDGRLLIGASVEEGKDDTATTAEEIDALLSFGRSLAPGTAHLKEVDRWAGVRPGTVDGLPIIGPCSIEGLLMATAHYRNGILWAPITSELVTNLVMGREAAPLLRNFAPDRFERLSETSG